MSRYKTVRLSVLALGVALTIPGLAGAQEADPTTLELGATELSIGGAVHTLFSTTSVDAATSPTLWELRKIRLNLRARVSERVGARIQPEFSGSRVKIKNAYVSLKFGTGTELKVGQARKPFGLKTSGKTRLFIERGARFRELEPAPYAHDNLITGLGYMNRDVGLHLTGKPAGAPLGLTYSVGVFNGPAHGILPGTMSFQVSGRSAVELTPDLRLGLSLSHRDFAPEPNDPSDSLRGGAGWAVDLEYGSYAPGLHLAAEYSAGAADPFSDSGRSFKAFDVWGGYRTARIRSLDVMIEPVARISYGRLDADAATIAAGGAGGSLLTPGVNVYLSPLNRIMIDYDVWRPRGGADSVRSLRVKFQVEF